MYAVWFEIGFLKPRIVLLDRREQSPGARVAGWGRRLGGTPVERKEVAVGVGFAGAVTVSPPASMHTHFFYYYLLFFRPFY